MESVKGRNFQEVLDLYEGRNAMQQKQEAEKEVLPVKDKDVLNKKILESARKAAEIYKSITAPNENSSIKIDRGRGWTNEIRFMPISFEVVDQDIPLTLVTMKRFRRDLNYPSGTVDEFFDVALLRGNFGLDKFKEVVDRLRKDEYKETDPDVVAQTMIFDRGKDFNFMHRIVNPRFRNQGFGRIMFQGVEEFAKGCAKSQNKNCDIFLDAFQLDLIFRLFEYGYVPASEEEEKKLDSILSGDPEFCIGEKYIIFPKTVPEKNRVHKNSWEALSVRFVKKIKPETRDVSIESIQEQTHRALS